MKRLSCGGEFPYIAYVLGRLWENEYIGIDRYSK